MDSIELGMTHTDTHSINTGDHPHTRQPMRRMSFALRDKVDEMVGDMLSQGVIQPSQSPWASPIVLVKEDGGIASLSIVGS